LNGDNHADDIRVIADNLNMPNGVAFRDGALYVAEVNRILRFDGIEDRLKSPPTPVAEIFRIPNTEKSVNVMNLHRRHLN